MTQRELVDALLLQARKKHGGAILPLGGRESIENGFKIYQSQGVASLWLNLPSGTTVMVMCCAKTGTPCTIKNSQIITEEACAS